MLDQYDDNCMIIFTSKTCSKCVSLKDMLENTEMNIPIYMVDVDTVNMEDVKQLNIRQLPTTVFIKDKNAVDIVSDLNPRSVYTSIVKRLYKELS